MKILREDYLMQITRQVRDCFHSLLVFIYHGKFYLIGHDLAKYRHWHLKDIVIADVRIDLCRLFNYFTILKVLQSYKYW